MPTSTASPIRTRIWLICPGQDACKTTPIRAARPARRSGRVAWAWRGSVSGRWVLTIEDLWERIRDTDWNFITSEGGAFSAGPVSGTAGNLYIKASSEPEGTQHRLSYTTLGVNAGQSIPVKGKEIPFSVGGASSDFFSTAEIMGGSIYSTTKMSLNDFNGMITFVEAGMNFGMPFRMKSKVIANAVACTVVLFHKVPLIPADIMGLRYAAGILFSESATFGMPSYGLSWTTGSVRVES